MAWLNCWKVVGLFCLFGFFFCLDWNGSWSQVIWSWSCSLEGFCYRFQGSCTGMPQEEERVCQMSRESCCRAWKSKQDAHRRTQGLKRLVLSQNWIRENTVGGHTRSFQIIECIYTKALFTLCLDTARKCRKNGHRCIVVYFYILMTVKIVCVCLCVGWLSYKADFLHWTSECGILPLSLVLFAGRQLKNVAAEKGSM